ncbi:response regulator, partial [Pseudomaricurvus sp.]|uniref:response regulator n=1 Tax=Pseudomaricurvus sp. TaxID=2004510 RepID=UPI003F6CE00E
ESEKGGNLEVLIVDRANGEKASSTKPSNHDDSEKDNNARTKGLWFTICKGLSECMNGSIDVDSPPGKETQYDLRLPLVAAQQSISLSSQPKLRDKKVLIIAPELPVGRFHLEEMLEWGMVIKHAPDYESAFQELLDAKTKGASYSMVLINLFQNIDAPLSFSQRLLEQFHDTPIPQIYLLSYNHLNERPVRLLVDENESVSFHYRPISPQSFHDLIAFNLLGKPITGEQIVEQEHLGAEDFSVLVVDDHRVNQMVAQGMLKKLGYHVRLAGNGLEALQEFQNRSVDLILMDCQMPEMDGFETTRRIRQLESEDDRKTRTPIIAMTAHVGDDDQSQCFASGMDDYIAKPVKYDVLQGHLLRWLGGSIAPETDDSSHQ